MVLASGRPRFSGKIVTIDGPIDPSELRGPTLVHEHLLIDFSVALLPPPGTVSHEHPETTFSLTGLKMI